MPLALLALLKANWKWIAIGVAIAALLGYIKFLHVEIDHYKTKAQQDEAVIAMYKQRVDDLTDLAASITAKYKQQLEKTNVAITENAKLVQDKIKLSKELAATRISLDAVRLFNESKRDPEAVAQPVQRDDGASGTTETVPLTGIFSIVAENDANHLRCIKQVESWQSFWGDYSRAVAQVNGT